jgi:Transposase DDE domain group 1
LSKTEKMRRFFQTSYAAASWSKPRKVVARVEASEQGSDIRFIVTNPSGAGWSLRACTRLLLRQRLKLSRARFIKRPFD